jgi:predicted extracellular nuclease
MDLEVGSNLYQNTDGTIEIEGVPQIQIALKPLTNALLVNFALFDESGKMTAKLVDSTLMFNERRAYEVTKAPSRVTLSHVESKNVVLDIEMKKPDVVSFTKGGFHTVKGHRLDVSSTEWKIDKQRASGTKQDLKGGPVRIG